MAQSKGYKLQMEQLISFLNHVDPYMEGESINKAWYDCISKTNIDEEPHKMWIDRIPFFKVFDVLENYYGDKISIVDRSAKRAGYIAENILLLLPYKGRWGAGWLVITNYSKTLVNVKYCLLKDGGLNGKEKEINRTAKAGKG